MLDGFDCSTAEGNFSSAGPTTCHGQGSVVKLVKPAHQQFGKLKVVTRRAAVKGRGKYQSVTAKIRIEMAFHTTKQNKGLGKIYSLGPKAVALNRVVVAEVFLQRQLTWLRYLAGVDIAATQTPNGNSTLSEMNPDNSRYVL